MGGHQGTGHRDVDGYRVGRAVERPHDNVDLGPLRRGRAKSVGDVDVGADEGPGEVSDEADEGAVAAMSETASPARKMMVHVPDEGSEVVIGRDGLGGRYSGGRCASSGGKAEV